MNYFIFVLFFIFYLTLNVAENYTREEWKYSANYKYYSKLWHKLQFLRWSLVFLTITLLLFGLENIIILFPSSVVWWILFDGLFNKLRGRAFFKVSEHKDLSSLERYASATNKFILLTISIILTLCYYLYIK